MLINQIATFLSNKSVLYHVSVIDYSRFDFGGKFKFIDFREKPTFKSRAKLILILTKVKITEEVKFFKKTTLVKDIEQEKLMLFF